MDSSSSSSSTSSWSWLEIGGVVVALGLAIAAIVVLTKRSSSSSSSSFPTPSSTSSPSSSPSSPSSFPTTPSSSPSSPSSFPTTPSSSPSSTSPSSTPSSSPSSTSPSKSPSSSPSSTPTFAPLLPSTTTPAPFLCYPVDQQHPPLTQTSDPDNAIFSMFRTNFPQLTLLSVQFAEFQYTTFTHRVEDLYGTYQNANGQIGRVVMTIQRDLADCDYPLLKGIVFENDPSLNQGPTCYHGIQWDPRTSTILPQLRNEFNAKFPGKTFASVDRVMPLSPTLVQLTVTYLGIYGYNDVWQGDIQVSQRGDCQEMQIVSEIINPKYQAWSG